MRARRFALLAAIATFAAPEVASAQMYWNWGPADYYYYEPRRVAPKPRVKRKPRHDPAEAAAKKAPKPVGPLVIAVSVQKQRLRVYDSNGLFAEAPVSTGTKSHPTPYGVFSIIQKNRHHVSNLYGASMPYMQRITWSGVAMHTGPLPGYAASHGCIRLPNEFAARLWTWTKMGTRVIVAPGEISPAEFSHPKLVARMVPLSTVSAAPGQTVASAAASPSGLIAPTEQQTADARETIENIKGTLSDAPPVQAQAGNSAESHSVDGVPSEEMTADESARADGAAAAANEKSDPPTSPETTSDTKPLDAAQEIAKPADIITPTSAGAPAVTAEPAKAAEKPRRHNHVAVFISRKDKRLYVRHGYEAVFDTPVEIADIDRPLGTHVFTAHADKDDTQALRWSVVSLPQVPRRSQTKRTRHGTRAAPATPGVIAPLDPSDALDRITIPAEAQEKIASIISPGGSLLISDHGLNGWETGKGTDFIVPLR